ncbi:hypothetical protein GTP38_24380 [Duganella sp. FT94W]|uniref:Uncharacterized protein n=1 Tax=Duganella lactea TaxID=2692173 RepID=A0ABW9VEK3_9BURK|nr:hypothetical protein [Duganella lactea]MYM37467.1 hypothetical protein [Duganella lactea]
MQRLKQLLVSRAREGLARYRRILYELLFTNEDGYSAALNWISLICLTLLVAAMVCDKLKLLPVRPVIGMIFTAIFLGLYVFTTVIEKKLAKHVTEFKSTQLFWVGLVAFLAYIAHGQAGDEVNSVFSQDTSTFPYATTAATAMVLGSWSLWPAFCTGMLSLVFGLYCMFKNQKAKLVLIAFTVGVQLSIFSIFVEYQMGTEAVRKNNIYQVALAMDFNGRFRCDDAQAGRDTVAFIGSSQNAALVAPPMVIRHENKQSIFKEVEVPRVFRRVSCT